MSVSAQSKGLNIVKLVFFSALVFAVFGLLAQVFVTNKFAVKGSELSRLMSEKVELEKEVSKLELQKATLSALPVLEARARQLGFVALAEHVNLIKPVSVAVLPQF